MRRMASGILRRAAARLRSTRSSACSDVCRRSWGRSRRAAARCSAKSSPGCSARCSATCPQRVRRAFVQCRRAPRGDRANDYSESSSWSGCLWLHPGVHVGGETLHQPRQIAPLGGGPIGHQFADLRLARLIDDGDDLAAGPGHLRFAHALVARAGAPRHQAEFVEPRHLPAHRRVVAPWTLSTPTY